MNHLPPELRAIAEEFQQEELERSARQYRDSIHRSGRDEKRREDARLLAQDIRRKQK